MPSRKRSQGRERKASKAQQRESKNSWSEAKSSMTTINDSRQEQERKNLDRHHVLNKLILEAKASVTEGPDGQEHERLISIPSLVEKERTCDHGFDPPSFESDILNFVSVFDEALEGFIGGLVHEPQPTTFMYALVGAVLPRLMDRGVIGLLGDVAKKKHISDCLTQLGTVIHLWALHCLRA